MNDVSDQRRQGRRRREDPVKAAARRRRHLWILAGALLLTCSRGYAADMVAAILAAGVDHGLRPAGEDRFSTWLAALKA